MNNSFQNQLSKDIKDIKNSNQVFVVTDKTKNVYKIKSDDYKLLNNNIMANYKRTNNSQMNDINKEAKIIVTKLNLDKRIGTFPNWRSFIMLKDHKSNFNHNLK